MDKKAGLLIFGEKNINFVYLVFFIYKMTKMKVQIAHCCIFKTMRRKIDKKLPDHMVNITCKTLEKSSEK